MLIKFILSLFLLISIFLKLHIAFGFSLFLNNPHIACQSDFEKVIHDEDLALSIWNKVKPFFSQEATLFTILEKDGYLVYFSTFDSRQERKLFLDLQLSSFENLTGLDRWSTIKYKIGGDLDDCKENFKVGRQIDCEIIEVKINGDKKNMFLNYNQETKMMRVSYECLNRFSRVANQYEFKTELKE